MKYKFFAVLLMCITTIAVGFGFAGCGDIYANLKVSVSETQISLRIDDNASPDNVEDSFASPETNQSNNSTLITATIEGATEEMLKTVDFWYADRSIVDAEVVSLKDNVSTIKLTAQNAGETILRVVSNEYGKVVSEDIVVKVFRDATKMTFNASEKPSISVGNSLELNTNTLINFEVNGEPTKIYPNVATFSLMQTDDPLWNDAYGTSIPSGVTIENNVLHTTAEADCGIVQLVASMHNGISTPVYVMIYKDILTDDIKLMQDGNTVEEVKAVINPIELTANTFQLSAYVNSLEQVLYTSIATADSDILILGEPNENGLYNVAVGDSGTTNVTVSAEIKDIVTGVVYKTYSKDFDVTVVRIVTDIYVSNLTVPETSKPANMVVQDKYTNGILGAEVHFKVSAGAVNSDVVLAITQIDGQEYTDVSCDDVQIYVNNIPYVWGQPVSSEPNLNSSLLDDNILYISLSETSRIEDNFVLEFRANTFDESLPVATNQITFTIETGVTAINPTSTAITLGVNTTSSFVLNYETTLGIPNVGSPRFTMEMTYLDVVEIADEGNYEYLLTGLKEGTTSIIVRAESGAYCMIDVQVKALPTEFYLSMPKAHSVDNIAEQEWQEDDFVNEYDNLADKGVTKFTIKQNSAIDISCIVNPAKISVDSFEILNPRSSDQTNTYISLSTLNEQNSFTLTAIKATEIDQPITITVNFTFYRESSGMWSVVSSSRTILVTVYKPINNLYWQDSSRQTTIDKVLYNPNHLNYTQQDLATTAVSVYHDIDATYFVKGGEIDWSVSDENKLYMSINDYGVISLTANLSELDTASSYVVYLYGRLTEYNKSYTLTCKVTIINPVVVSSIEVTNYNSAEGVRLNDLGAKNRTQYELYTKINPKNVYNSDLGYKIYNINSEDELVEATDEDAIISLDETNPNIIKAIEGKSGRAVLRIYPLDAIVSPDIDLSTILHVDILVIVEDGETNPYSIYNAEEFIAIGNSAVALTKNYVVMQSIDLSNYQDYLPLGKQFGGVFSGSISSYNYETSKTKFAILNISPSIDIVSEDVNSYGGLFAKIAPSDMATGVNNLDFYFTNTLIDLTNAGENAFVGLLAGSINCDLDNVFVNFANYNNSSLTIKTTATTNQNITFGAIAGSIAGSATNVRTNIATNFNLSDTTSLVAGGAFGLFSGAVLGQNVDLINNVKFIVNRSTNLNNDSIGGLVGVANKYNNGSTDVNGIIKSMQVNGIINAPNFNNVGGFVGVNNIILGDFVEQEYRNLASVRVNAQNNVGGLIGVNNGAVRYSKAENYDIANETNAYNLVGVQGKQNVGGLVGQNNGSIQYSYAISYITRSLVAKDEVVDNLLYYGDVLGEDNVGGLVGISTDAVIINSFARNKLQQTSSAGLIGGFVGNLIMSSPINQVYSSFAIGEIYTQNTNTAQIGEFAGEFTGSTAQMIANCYAVEYIRIFDGTGENALYNFVGTNVNNTTIASSFYLVNSVTPNPTTNADGTIQATLDKLKLSLTQNIYQEVGWGFSKQSDDTKQEWVAYEETLQGVNDNLPILFDKDGSWLFNQSLNSIQVTPLEYKETNNILPTYFDFEYTVSSVAKVGSVVVLDNISTDTSTGQKVIPLFNNDTISGMFDIAVAPNISPEKWQISVTSSDFNIVEVVQSSQNLIGAYLVFKKTGIVTLTFRSLLNVNVVEEIVINVIGGFDSFDILTSEDNSIIDDTLYVKKDNGLGYSLYPQFVQKNDVEYIGSRGIVYSVAEKQYIDFVGLNYVGSQIFAVADSNPTIIVGREASSDAFEVGVAPFIDVNFGGTTYQYVFYDLAQKFDVKVYNGISNVSYYKKEASTPSGGNSSVDFIVETDNTATITIQDLKVKKDNEAIDSVEASKYITLVNTNVVTDEKVVNTYLFELKGDDRFITQNITFDVEFTVSDESGDTRNLSMKVIFTPAEIERVELKHFTYGAGSMEMGEVASDLIAPGTQGILKVEITPQFAFYDYVVVGSSIDAVTQDYVKMTQVVYKNGTYRTIAGGTQYDALGNVIAQKVTGVDERGNSYFNGVIYLTTLISNFVTEGTQFIVTAAPMRNGVQAPVFTPRQLTLNTTFAPYATLSLQSAFEGDIIARGTVANLRLTGVLQNSTIELDMSYGDGLALIDLERCAFGSVQTRFMSGQRENVDMIIPFYVGLLASPDNGKIIISITIRSRTDTGGELNPLVITYTINVVDYIVDNVFANGTQTGDLNVGIRNYTTLNALWTLVTPNVNDYVNYVGGNTDEFNANWQATLQKATYKLALLNARGDGNGGIWQYNDGSGYGIIDTSKDYSTNGFIVSYTTFDNGESYYIIRGRGPKVDVPFRLYFESFYVYDYVTGCYTFATEEDINEFNQNKVLENYLRKLEQNFNADMINNTNDDTPETIDSAATFRTMSEGASYMLTSDIVLYDWAPLNTAIKSLDGNGYVIYLRSFAKNTNATTANYGLFGSISSDTVLKNLIIDVSYNIWVDLQNVNNVNFGFIAGTNQGTIYNCEVVVSQNKEEWKQVYDNTSQIVSTNADYQFGSKIFNQIASNAEPYDKYNTLASSFILTSKTTTGGNVIANIGGLVGNNEGSITNSRVGKVDTQNVLGFNNVTPKYGLQGLNIFASGNVGGLVGQNSGTISNSYYANGYVVNSRMDIYSNENTNGARTGGLVAVQTSTGRIIGSYARGQLQDDDARSNLGGVVAYGTIGGLVHSNAGEISNSYSNMTLSSSNGMGGFVYENTGTAVIKYCYSLSNVKTQGLINGVFIGLDSEGNLLDGANTDVQNCFYLNSADLIVDANERAVGLSVSDWSDALGSAFEGFVISNDDTETTWYIDNQKVYLGPQLYLADRNFVSHRNNDLLYQVGYELGSKNNPDIIANMSDWTDKVFNFTSEQKHSSYMTSTNGTSNEAKYKFGENYIMLLNDLDFNYSIDAQTSNTIFSGKLFGNGHTILNINYTQSSTITTTPNDFGLFNKIENGIVSNLNLVVDTQLRSRASHIGVLAGTIKDALIENVIITGNSRATQIIGTNLAGALAGLVQGNSKIYNITSTLSVSANASTITGKEYTYFNPDAVYASTYSYAGGLIGALDLNQEDDVQSNPRVRNLKVTSTVQIGTTKKVGQIDIYGEIVGGVVGLIGTNAEVYKAFFDIDTDITAKIRGRNFAGGVVGENRGMLLNSRISMPENKQTQLDSQILDSHSALDYVDYKDLFSHQDTINAVGGLVGLNLSGLIGNSYSRVSVVATNAKVAGGLIGLAVEAPKDYNTSSGDVNLNYLRNINLNGGKLLTTITGGANYTITSGQLTTDKEKMGVSAILKEVYTTGAVEANQAFGGLVGGVIGAPILTQTLIALIAGVNNYHTDNQDFIDAVNDTSIYKGSAIGYLGFNYRVTPLSSQVVAFVSDANSGTSAQSIKVTPNIANIEINPIGNVAGALNSVVVTTNFIKAATSVDDSSFKGFDANVWNLDEQKLNHRFPILRLGYDSPVTNIETVEQFFDAMSNTKTNSHNRIIKDLEITGTQWETFVIENGRRSLASSATSPVQGRLEGAVPVIVSGQYTTRSAKITFKDFSNTQMNMFHSLFGYTRSFRLMNIDFVFTFDFDASNIAQTQDFALIAFGSNSSHFENVSLSFTNSYSMIMNLDTINTNSFVTNIALFVAKSQNSTFTNVSFDADLNVTNYDTASIESIVAVGGLFAVGTVNNAINGAELGEININFATKQNKDYEISLGGLVGRSEGILNITGAIKNEGNLKGSLNLTAQDNSSAIYLGGAVGQPQGIVVLKNFSTQNDITLTRTGNNARSQNYVGGIAGVFKNSNISGATSFGAIDIEANSGEMYVGGIAGFVENEQTFSGSNSSLNYSGYSTQVASSKGSISVVGQDFASLYVGGVYGLTRENIILSVELKSPIGISRNIYNALYSNATISTDVSAVYYYIGGLIGNAQQGILAEGVYTPFEKSNNVLRISGVGFAGDIFADNQENSSGANYVGGIVGASQLAVENALSVGLVSFGSNSDRPAYIGGIVGFAENHIVSSVSLAVMNISKVNELNASNIGVIVGAIAVGQDNKPMGAVQSCYYSAELSGMFSNYGINLSAEEVYSAETCTLMLPNLVNWTFAEVTTNNSNVVAILYPMALGSMVDLTAGSEFVPVFVQSISMLNGYLNDDEKTRKTIMFSNDIDLTTVYNTDLTNVRRLVGNGYNLNVTNDYLNTYVQNDFGLFSVNPRNTLISSINVNFTILDLTATSASNIGGLVGTNYGSIFKVTVGELASLDSEYNSANPIKTVANFGEGVANRYTSKMLASQEVATIKVKANSTANVGGLAGLNYGLVVGCYTNVDLIVTSTTNSVNVGSIAGQNEKATLNNIYTSGRISLMGEGVVGGIAGQNIYSLIEAGIVNTNISAFSSTQIGLAFGNFANSIQNGILVNSNISANHSLNEFNSYFTRALTNAEMASAESLNFIKEQQNMFVSEYWTQEPTQNYGYPTLINLGLDFNTGDGSINAPYEITEAVQLLDLNKTLPETYYALARDMMISLENYTITSLITLNIKELNGYGHTVVIHELPDTTENAVYLGLFNTIGEITTITNLGLAVCNDIDYVADTQINFGTLAVNNYGNINNVYAISNGFVNFINSQPNSKIGGLVSQNFGNISNSWCDVNILGKDGYFGGIIGSQGQEKTDEQQIIRQATIARCFSNGAIILRNSTNAQTSAGGIIGRNVSILAEGYVLQDCYVYGAQFMANVIGLNIGTIIGFNATQLNTYRTYSYAYTPSADMGGDNAGNYINLGMVGNQADLTTKDETSSVTIYLGDATERTTQSSEDVATVVKVDVLRTSGIGSDGIYLKWGGMSSPWKRNLGVDVNVYALYLNKVTPADRQEKLSSIIDAETIFGI